MTSTPKETPRDAKVHPSPVPPTLNAAQAEERYPEPLRDAEANALRQRRSANAAGAERPPVGFALSGGGIRSATFCLGLFQALARQRLIRHIDYLSTVSGGGYFGSCLGAAFARDGSTAEAVERELSNNHSWTVNWLRENGRFLSPNGSGDNWLTAAVALRNWVALHVVLLTFSFLVLGFGTLVRADLCTATHVQRVWRPLEQFFWDHDVLGIWWSPWMVLPAIAFALLMVPTGTVYWLTQLLPLMTGVRRVLGLFNRPVRAMSSLEFASRAQYFLTRGFMFGLVVTFALLCFALIDSFGQTAYYVWSRGNFEFPSLWAALTTAGFGLYGLAAKVIVYVERLLGSRKFRTSFDVIALGLALVWVLLIVFALSVLSLAIAWRWEIVWNGTNFIPMSGGWPLMMAVGIAFVASWIFSRSFGFVNLSSMQQMYASRLSRAYMGVTNPIRQRSANQSMTELIPGDDLPLESYSPHRQGGPLHLINITVNETISGKTQIERRDRKGLALAVGPGGLSVGTDSHAVWPPEGSHFQPPSLLHALWEDRRRPILPVSRSEGRSPARRGTVYEAFPGDHGRRRVQHIEALTVGRWIAISGAAFTTGTGANTTLGLSLLLGLANVRLGYWWDSGVEPPRPRQAARPNFLEMASRVVSRIMPVQTYLITEFFARFHGPGRRHWYLSDGGHFENTGCYELIRRHLPFIVCSDAGQDPQYQFADLANLVRKARTDFAAEIQVVRRAGDLRKDDPGADVPLPTLEQLVHPALLDVIGSPEDFPALAPAAASNDDSALATPPYARRHALLARIHYLDTDTFGWLLLIKPSLMGDESMDVVQYQHTHSLFPQEPTSDQYFDEAQWESYRKLGEHIGTELFSPAAAASANGVQWTPSMMTPPAAGPRPAPPDTPKPG